MIFSPKLQITNYLVSNDLITRKNLCVIGQTDEVLFRLREEQKLGIETVNGKFCSEENNNKEIVDSILFWTMKSET